jgi:AcrR family transcriptional regulator
MPISLSATRRARERDTIRERILDAARELFAAEGYEAVTMRRVAERIEYTPPVIYQHFADKATLIGEVTLRDFRLLAQAFQKLAGVADPIERLRLTGEQYVEFALTHPNHYRLMFMTPEPPDAAAHAHLDVAAKGNPQLDAYAFLRATVDEAFQAGRFNPQHQDPALIAHVVWQGLHGVVAMHNVRGDDQWVEYRDPRATAALHIEVTLRGLTCDAR